MYSKAYCQRDEPNGDTVFDQVGRQIALIRLSSPSCETTAVLEKSRSHRSGTILWYGVDEFEKDRKSFCTIQTSSNSDRNVPTLNGFNSFVENDTDSDEEFKKDFMPETPPPNYLCNSCGRTGHWIKYCPNLPPDSKTPYLGPKRSVGLFVCQKCKRQWKSKNSFSQQGQQCNKCRVTVVPKKQYPMEKALRSGIYPDRRDRRNGSVCSSGTANNSEGPSPSTSPFTPDYHGSKMFIF